jgi:transcriptional regulatory protein RtcR
MGPTGAGKTQLARRIYELKRTRRQVEGRFVEVNCATLRGDAAMSTLFGHVKGAYTGAVSDRPGLLRAADGGVMFLDEIGELGLDEQAMLLRALESKRFMPVGADAEVTSDFQLIAGTNRALRERVAKGEFREDLLARINLWSFSLPGLRDRIEDLEPNLDFELDRFTERVGERVSMNREARKQYLDFAMGAEASWRANFRDLNASVTRMSTLASGGRINNEIVDEEIDRLRSDWRRVEEQGAGEKLLEELLGEEGVEALDLFDRAQLAEVVRVCAESKSLSAAGRALFAVSRLEKKSSNDADRLRKYLARFELTFQQIQEG